MNDDMHIKEYELLRQEILQYMEEYQSVRNMMYIVTVSILALSEKLEIAYYFYLLPLVVIIPSYVLYYSYNRCVAVASTYLQVFHESDDKSVGYQWEGRHAKFSDLMKEKKGKLWRVFDMVQGRLAFMLCSLACFIVYYVRAHSYWIEESSTRGQILFDVMIGIFCIIVTWIIFFALKRVKEPEIKAMWTEIKASEAKKIDNNNEGETNTNVI